MLSADEAAMVAERKTCLRDWGRKRERRLQRSPPCLMDQLISGSGYYPVRLLEEHWFTEREKAMVTQLESLLQCTGHGTDLAKDMLTPLMYDVDVRIILDNSGSMSLDMFGMSQWGGGNIDARTQYDPMRLQQVLTQTVPIPWGFQGPQPQPATTGISPHHKRWYHARHTVQEWRKVFEIMGLDPPVQLLNPIGRTVPLSQVDAVFQQGPQGSTPMTEALQVALQGRNRATDRPMLILAITDGEANNMQTFSILLDKIQNGVYGDVQVCILGLSLVNKILSGSRWKNATRRAYVP
jgi:hypothetical protein